MEPLRPCSRMFPLKLQALLTAHANREEEDPEAALPQLGQQL